MTKSTIGLSVAVFAAGFGALAAANAMAYNANDIIVRVGAATVAPNADSGKLKIDGASATGSDVVKIGNDTQAGFSATWMISPNWGVELLASTQFEHKISAKGDLTGVTSEVGKVRHLPPTLTLQWYPLGASDSAWQPYVGAGVNYIWFHDEQLSSELKSAGASSLQIDNSLSPAAQVGIDFLLDPNWLINVSAMYVDSSTEAKFRLGASSVRLNVDVNPWVYRFNVGYRF